MVPTRQERKAKIAAERRQQILDAALDVFTRQGFASATTAEIARTAGVAEGTIYNYFPSKRELFVDVIKNFIITMPLLELIDKIPKGKIDDIFKSILMNRFDLIQDMSAFQIPSLMAEIQRDPELRVIWRKQFIQPFLSRMEAVYRFMAASDKFRRIEPVVAVRTVGGMILGFLILKIMEGEASPLNKLSREKVIDEIASLLLHGLLTDIPEQGN
jgi:AcrR family transcriptional regulator